MPESQMTAAEHFQAAELLIFTADHTSADRVELLLARADRHLAAARFLLDVRAHVQRHNSTDQAAGFKALAQRVR